jgi:hypothetical protein
VPNNVFFGLDNTQPNVLRVASVLVEKPFHTSVFAYRRCQNFKQFQTFVEANFTPALAATSTLHHDPCAAIAWTTQRQIAVRRYTPLDLFHPSDLDQERYLPRVYKSAYSLAIRAAYEFEAPRALESLWREIYWARETFERLERTANALCRFDEVPF